MLQEVLAQLVPQALRVRRVQQAQQVIQDPQVQRVQREQQVQQDLLVLQEASALLERRDRKEMWERLVRQDQ